MSNTYRRDRVDKVFKEGLKKKDGWYRCDCHHCVGVDRKILENKIAKKEMKEEIKETEENIGLMKEYNTLSEITALVKSIPNDMELGRAVRELFS